MDAETLLRARNRLDPTTYDRPFRDLTQAEQDVMATQVALRAGFSAHHAVLRWDNAYPAIEEKLKLTAQTMKSCYIGGNLGVGKTAYLAIMFKEAFLTQAQQAKYRPAHVEPTAFFQKGVYLYTHAGLIDAMHEALKGDDADTIHRLYSAALVIVDDLGTGHEDRQGYNVGMFERLIDYRWSRQLPVWISSNIDAAEFRDAAEWKRIYSRWQDVQWMPAKRIWISGENRRKRCNDARSAEGRSRSS